MKDVTLLNICILKVSSLLRDCYWPIGCFAANSLDKFNPFSAVPTHLNEELISTVIQLLPSGTLSIRHLYLIISSGRIRNFAMEDVLLPTEEFVGVLTALSVHGMHLKKLILQKIYCLETPDEKYQSMTSAAIECLLTMSPNLEHITIDKAFDLKVIQNMQCLKHLELNFVPKNPLFDLIPSIDDCTFIPNETLSHLYVFEDYRNQVPIEEIAFLLQYCPELTCIKNNLGGPLELLHGEDLFCGSLTKQYKLQKYTLGSVFVSSNEGTASVSIIHIAALTCPNTKQLDILVNDHQAISALADFKNMSSFLIQWEKATSGDFRLGLQSVFQSIGPELKDLSIFNFNNIDFTVIGDCCPQLQELRIECDNEVNVNDVKSIYFKQLTMLHLQCENVNGITSNTMMLLLSNCKELTSLCLDNIHCFTDELLATLLRKNDLGDLKEVSLVYCSLTEQGLAHLVKSCPLLEFICFTSAVVSFESTVRIIHDINPLVIVSTKT